jgi:Ca-activated chloride channel homolog
MHIRRVRFAVMGLSAIGVAAVGIGVLWSAAPEGVVDDLVQIPDRYVELILDEPAPERRRGNPDAGEGARARKEVGGVGKREVDRQIAEGGGVLGAMADSDLNQVLGASGAGGLGVRGSGLGGGGTAEGLGGLGTKGAGHSGAVGTLGAPARTGSERYTDHGVNDFAITATDRVSTFSVDVDTGSYPIARRKLREGSLPPPAAVRVEEFVNYLDYAYTPPADDAMFSVRTELAPHPHAPDRHLLRVGIKGRELPTANRPPVHLTFLVDVSGSMASADKLPLARRALHYLVDNLGPEDTVAIATYAGGERRVLEPTHTTRAQRIHDAIDSLAHGGGTAMASGMELAYAMASDARLEGAENRVIVLSDGDANIGRSSHEGILDTIAGYAGRGITLSTIGFGMGNYQDTLMEQLADRGDGNYAYVDSMDEAKKVFGTDLAGTIRTIARDVKIQVDLDPAAVHAYRLVGYENRDIADRDFRDDRVDAGEVGSGHQVTALYELILTDAAPTSAPIATVRLRAKPPGRDRPAREWSVPVGRGSVAGFDAASADTRLVYGVATFAELLRGSPHTAEVSWDDVLRVVRGATDPERDDHRELIELIERARALAMPEVATR